MTSRQAPPLRQWLCDNGLSDHAGAFGDGPVDAEVLADLTDADLAALGLGRMARLCFRRAVSQRLMAEAAAGTGPLVRSGPTAGRR